MSPPSHPIFFRVLSNRAALARRWCVWLRRRTGSSRAAFGARLLRPAAARRLRLRCPVWRGRPARVAGSLWCETLGTLPPHTRSTPVILSLGRPTLRRGLRLSARSLERQLRRLPSRHGAAAPAFGGFGARGRRLRRACRTRSVWRSGCVACSHHPQPAARARCRPAEPPLAPSHANAAPRGRPTSLVVDAPRRIEIERSTVEMTFAVEPFY